MRILVAEDDSVTRRLLESQLEKWGHQVITCVDGTSAWELLTRQDAPRLIILDWMMPGMDGVNICRNIRKLEQHPYRYLILLTSKSHQDDIVEGLEAGADDYVTKPFNPSELKGRIRVGARIIELHEKLTAALEKSEFQATHDSLTGILNRAAILRTLAIESDRARRNSVELGVILVDIDNFKRVNDSHGHLIGDAVLKEIARRLATSLRPYDSLGRYGGEEFVVVLPSCSENNAMNAAERLRSLIAEEPVSTSAGELVCTISLGATVGHGESIRDVDTLIRMADEALYRAKRGGRNRVELCM